LPTIRNLKLRKPGLNKQVREENPISKLNQLKKQRSHRVKPRKRKF